MRLILRMILPAALLFAAPTGHARDRPLPPDAISGIPVVLLADMGAHQVLYSREPDRRFAPASLTKVMTAYLAFERMAQGKLRADQSFTVGERAAREWRGRGASLYLDAGSSVPAEVLIRGVTTVSANDGAVVLAEGIAGSVENWSRLMNAQARGLGMTNSRFASPNGWPDKGATYASAQDLFKLSVALIERHPSLYRRYFGQKRLSWNGMNQENRDPTLGVVAGADGIKTGFTREAGYNFLGSAERDGRRLVIVIGGARSEAERARAARALFEWGFGAWRPQALFGPGQRIGVARVQGGAARSVGLVAAKGVSAAVPVGHSPSLRIRYKGPLVAPIRKGDPVAVLEVGIAGAEAAGEVPLLAAAAVKKAGPLDRLIHGLLGLFS